MSTVIKLDNLFDYFLLNLNIVLIDHKNKKLKCVIEQK